MQNLLNTTVNQMNTLKIVTRFLFFLLFLTSCNKAYKFSLEIPKKTTLDKTITATLQEENNQEIDSVQFFINGAKVTSTTNTTSIATSNYGIGKHVISALAFYPGKTKKVNNSFEVYPTTKPAIYNFEIVNTYPHDTNAYTQGLEYYNGYLYETTGQRGASSLRKVDIKTGKVLQKIDLDDKYFGEGMTIFNNEIIWLTWQNKKGFVYDLETFKQKGTFEYNQSAEGWGLTNNGKDLIKTDGTNRIWFLDPTTKKEKTFKQAYTVDRAVDNLNELEFINGKLYANKYQQNTITIIDPNTGVVEGLVDLRPLEKEMSKTQKLVPQDEVLNGIAYDKENDRLFVTGKKWGSLFEIKIIKRQ